MKAKDNNDFEEIKILTGVFDDLVSQTKHPDAKSFLSYLVQLDSKFLVDIFSRWGTSYFATALKSPMMPDYFLFNDDREEFDFSICWKAFSKHINLFHEDGFNNCDQFINPCMSLIVAKSTNLLDARLARYFISKSCQKTIVKTLDDKKNSLLNRVLDRYDVNKESAENVYNKLLTSRYWELFAAVGGQLFGRKNMLTEMPISVRGEIQDDISFNKLLIVINEDKKKSNGPLRFLDGEERICIISPELANLLGSQNCDDILQEIRQKIQSYVLDAIMRTFIVNKVDEDEVRFEINRLAAEISKKVRNGRYHGKSFDEVRGYYINRALALIFGTAENIQNSLGILDFLMWKNGEERNGKGDKGKESLLQLFLKLDHLRAFMLSLFDVNMFAPWWRSMILYYGQKKSESSVWAILGDKALGPSEVKAYSQDKSHGVAKKFTDVFLERLEIIGKVAKKIDVTDPYPRLQSAIEKNKIGEIPIGYLQNDEWRQKHIIAAQSYFALCLVLETCSYITNEVHEGSPLDFTFLITGSNAWRAFDDIISDAEHFHPPSLKWTAENSRKMIKSNYSIFQLPRVVAFFDRKQVWDDNGLKIGKIVKIAESTQNRGFVGFPFYYHSRWEMIENWSDHDFIVHVHGSKIIVLQGKSEMREGREEKIVEPFILWNTKENTIEILKNENLKAKKFVEIFCDNDEVKYRLLLDVITSIATNSGEGALAVFHNMKNNFGNDWRFGAYDEYFAPMDAEKWIQIWRRRKNILCFDRDMLRALLRMDGATRIVKEQTSSDIEVGSRLSLRPPKYTDEEAVTIDNLSGKGSRHHSAAAFSKIFEAQWSDGKSGKEAVIVVSADGPISLFPKDTSEGL